jgi:hypothetical protein
VSEGITSVLSALRFSNPGLHLMQTLFILNLEQSSQLLRILLIITPCKQVPPPVFFQFFHNPHHRSPIQFKKIRSATRSKLSAQGRGIQRSHYITLWDSAQAIC